jgi:hypothetical protein
MMLSVELVSELVFKALSFLRSTAQKAAERIASFLSEFRLLS